MKRAYLLAPVLIFGLSACSWVGLVSVDSSGQQANGSSETPSISEDGQFVAFRSSASNLVLDDVGGFLDVFVRDLKGNTTTRVSVNSNGEQANDSSFRPRISADGRFVAFASRATNLVDNDTNGFDDLFVHDRQTGATTRVNIDSSGAEANAGLSDYEISSDGRYVVFDSFADNLVPGDTNGFTDVFIHDRVTGETTRISEDNSGVEGDGQSRSPDISADGRYVVFQSLASNFVASDNTFSVDIFVHDRQTGTKTRVNVDSSGVVGNNNAQFPRISGDGQVISFESFASNLVAGDTNNVVDVFVHEVVTGATTRVSVDSNGVEQNDFGGFDINSSSISTDGRYVSFMSRATNLVGDDTNGVADVFVHDRQTGTTSRVSLDALGSEGVGTNRFPIISGDGRYVAFSSSTDNFTQGDTNGLGDIFLKSVPALTVTSIVPDMLPIGATTSITLSGSPFLPGVGFNIPDVQQSNVVIVDENTVTMDVTVPSTLAAGTRSVIAVLPGTGPGLLRGSTGQCQACVTLF